MIQWNWGYQSLPFFNSIGEEIKAPTCHMVAKACSLDFTLKKKKNNSHQVCTFNSSILFITDLINFPFPLRRISEQKALATGISDQASQVSEHPTQSAEILENLS